MSLSCECFDDYDWYYEAPKDYSILDTSKRKRCVSCNDLIDIKSVCVKFPSFRFARDDVEERIYGSDEVPMADKYMCEKCGDLYFSLDELGFCVKIGGDETMRDLIEEYQSKYINQVIA